MKIFTTLLNKIPKPNKKPPKQPNQHQTSFAKQYQTINKPTDNHTRKQSTTQPTENKQPNQTKQNRKTNVTVTQQQ